MSEHPKPHTDPIDQGAQARAHGRKRGAVPIQPAPRSARLGWKASPGPHGTNPEICRKADLNGHVLLRSGVTDGEAQPMTQSDLSETEYSPHFFRKMLRTSGSLF